MRRLSQNGHCLHDHYKVQKYGCMMHGIGLCDEWNLIDGTFKYELAAGMVLCVKALVPPKGDSFDINLEDQILITENGFKNLTTYKFDRVLMGEGNIVTIRKTHKKGTTAVAPFNLDLNSELFACGANEAPNSGQK